MPIIRVSAKTRATLHDLARDMDAPMVEIVDQAIELYRRQRFIDQANAGYAALRDDPEAWAEIEAERAAWDGTLLDGLEIADKDASGKANETARSHQ
jgi:hypothetical protein